MSLLQSITFPALAGTANGFVLRHPELAMNVERQEALERLAPWHQGHVCDLGFEPVQMRSAEQVHGDAVAVVDADSPMVSSGADGLITRVPTVILAIYVADCAAVYLHDPVQHAIGLVHSGRKGSELGITARAIEMMNTQFGSSPKDLVIQVSPCIRPPAYEVDFAAQIREQCLDSGILPDNFHDDGICTARDLSRFYSYREERGRTGRMLALFGLKRAC